MYATSTGIVDGVIADRFGKRGEVNEHGMPTLSLPLSIHEAPGAAACFAVVVEDKDAYPVSGGFAWIHWLAANIEETEIEEGASATRRFPQGANSWTSVQGGSCPSDVCSAYGGMAPPDAEHLYEIHVYALDAKLPLSDGFLFNDLHRAMDGHVVASCTLKGAYDK